MKNENERKLKTVTSLPKWILKLLGRYHAKHGGVNVVDMHIKRWEHKLNAFENEVLKEEEKAMHPIRESAAQAISTISRMKDEIHLLPEHAPEESPSPTDPKSIRAVRNAKANAASKKNMAISKNAASTEDIIRFNELIISSNVDVREYIEYLRNHYSMCVDSYLAGVRKVLPDYAMVNSFSNKALEIYEMHHRILDNEIQRIAYNMVNNYEEMKEAS